MSFFAVAPKEIVKIMKVELQKKREEEEKEEKEEAKVCETDKDGDKTAEPEVKELYEHPQSRLFSKMAALVGGKPVSSLPVDPAAAPGHEVRVMDRKLEEDEERLKKDNRRWKGIIYLTIAVSVIILCLVVAQVISSITSSKTSLPNIDVSEPVSPRLRAEPLVASMPQLDGADNRQTIDPAETVEADIVEIDTILANIDEKQTEADNEEENAKQTPLSQNAEDKQEPSSTTPASASAKPKKPFFMPIMFGQGQISFKNPMAEFLSGSPPFREEAIRPRNPFLELLLGGRSQISIPPPPPLPMEDEEDPLLMSDIEVVEEIGDEDDPFFEDVLRGMKTLLETVRPLLDQEPLPQEVTLNRVLPPRSRLLSSLQPPPRQPDEGTGFLPLAPEFPPQRSPEFGRSFARPPAAFRPGPFRAPVSVIRPQIRPANARPPFPPRPTNQRTFRPRGQVRFLQPQPITAQRRPFPPFFSNLHQSGSARHYNPVNQSPRLVGNPLYSYPNTATGIQDIIHFIRQGNGPQPRPGPEPNHSPNNQYFAGDHFHGNHNDGPFRDEGFHGIGRFPNDDDYSGPIYPDGYNGPRAQLGSQQQPFHLMMDVYPVDNGDRYIPAPDSNNPLIMEQNVESPQRDREIFPAGMEPSLDEIFPDDMPLPDMEGKSGHPKFLVPEGRALHIGIPPIPTTPNHPPFEHTMFLNPDAGREGKSLPLGIPPMQIPQQVTVVKKVIIPNHQTHEPHIPFVSDRPLPPFVQIRPEQSAEKPMGRVPVVHYAPAARDRFIPQQHLNPFIQNLHVKDRGMDGVNIPQESQGFPPVQTFPMGEMHRPQGRGFPLPPSQMNQLPIQNQQPHIKERLLPPPVMLHPQMQVPQHSNVNHNEKMKQTVIHRQPVQRVQNPPQLHSETLSQVREMPVTVIHEHKAIPQVQRMPAIPLQHAMPQFQRPHSVQQTVHAPFRQDSEIPQTPRTPLYHLLLADASRRDDPGHLMEETHLPESVARHDNHAAATNDRLFSLQTEHAGMQQPPLVLLPHNTVPAHAISEQAGPQTEGSSFQGDPWNHGFHK